MTNVVRRSSSSADQAVFGAAVSDSSIHLWAKEGGMEIFYKTSLLTSLFGASLKMRDMA